MPIVHSLVLLVVIGPAVGSYSRLSGAAIVDLPDPEVPMRMTLALALGDLQTRFWAPTRRAILGTKAM